MLKYVIDGEGEVVEVVANGTLREICANVCTLIHGLYGRLSERDSDCGKAFREMISAAVSDEASPMWKSDEELMREMLELRIGNE